MKRKDFISKISNDSGNNVADIEKVLAAIPAVLTQACINGDSVAIPRFGTFSALKTDEYISTDEITGKRRLCPPNIRIHFRPSVILRKKLE